MANDANGTEIKIGQVIEFQVMSGEDVGQSGTGIVEAIWGRKIKISIGGKTTVQQAADCFVEED